MQDIFKAIRHWALHHCVVFGSLDKIIIQDYSQTILVKNIWRASAVSTFRTIMRYKWWNYLFGTPPFPQSMLGIILHVCPTANTTLNGGRGGDRSGNAEEVKLLLPCVICVNIFYQDCPKMGYRKLAHRCIL